MGVLLHGNEPRKTNKTNKEKGPAAAAAIYLYMAGTTCITVCSTKRCVLQYIGSYYYQSYTWKVFDLLLAQRFHVSVLIYGGVSNDIVTGYSLFTTGIPGMPVSHRFCCLSSPGVG